MSNCNSSLLNTIDDANTKIASKRYLSQIHKGDKELFRSEGGTSQQLWGKFFEGQAPHFQSYHWDVVFEDGNFTKFGLRNSFQEDLINSRYGTQMFFSYLCALDFPLSKIIFFQNINGF